MACKHPRMISTSRIDKCPDCGYEFYYGDAHATGDAQLSKLINRGDDDPSDHYEDHHKWEHDHWRDLGGEG